MPKRDHFHAAIRAAFEKDGWIVTHDPMQFVWEDKVHYPDLGVERLFAAERGSEKLAVEIKSFLSQNFSHEFYEAIGQYDNYFFALADIEPERKVVVAITATIFETFFQKKYVQRILELKKMPIVVVDIENQRIEQWIN